MQHDIRELIMINQFQNVCDLKLAEDHSSIFTTTCYLPVT